MQGPGDLLRRLGQCPVPEDVPGTGLSVSRYSLEYSADTLHPDWDGVPGQTNVSGIGGHQFLDVPENGVSRRYYRLRVIQP